MTRASTSSVTATRRTAARTVAAPDCGTVLGFGHPQGHSCPDQARDASASVRADVISRLFARSRMAVRPHRVREGCHSALDSTYERRLRHVRRRRPRRAPRTRVDGSYALPRSAVDQLGSRARWQPDVGRSSVGSPASRGRPNHAHAADSGTARAAASTSLPADQFGHDAAMRAGDRDPLTPFNSAKVSG